MRIQRSLFVTLTLSFALSIANAQAGPAVSNGTDPKTPSPAPEKTTGIGALADATSGTVTGTSAESPLGMFRYIGGVMLRSENPQALAKWYTDKFGIKIDMAQGKSYFGGFQSASGMVSMGIVPSAKGASASSGAMLTFRVANFEQYLAEAKARGLEPASQEKDEGGRFATFKDIDGNKVMIWGD